MELPSILEKDNFEIDCPQKLLEGNNVTLNKHIFSYWIQVTNKIGSCLVIPNYRGNLKYILYICPTLDTINQKSKDNTYLRKSIDINCFNFDMVKYSYNVCYDSVNDYPNLLECINAYLRYNKGDYGYYENDRFYNENDIINMLKVSYDVNKYKYACTKNIFDGPEFDIYIILNQCDYNSIFSALSLDRLANEYFPYDTFGIRFSYNKKKDEYNCTLDIEYIVYDLIEVTNDYYKKINKQHEFKYNDHCKKMGKYIIKGSFMKLFKILSDFVMKLKDVISDK